MPRMITESKTVQKSLLKNAERADWDQSFMVLI